MPTLANNWFRGRAKSEEPPRDRQLREHFKKLKPRSDAQFKARQFLSTPTEKVILPAMNHRVATIPQAPNTQPMRRRALLPEIVQSENHRPLRVENHPSHQPIDVRFPSLPGGKTHHPRGRPHQDMALGVRPREYNSYEEYIRPLSRSKSLPPLPRRSNQVRNSKN